MVVNTVAGMRRSLFGKPKSKMLVRPDLETVFLA